MYQHFKNCLKFVTIFESETSKKPRNKGICEVSMTLYWYKKNYNSPSSTFHSSTASYKNKNEFRIFYFKKPQMKICCANFANLARHSLL